MVATRFGLASGVRSVTGAVVGCPLGAVTGGALTAVMVVGTPLGIVGGCLIGVSAVGAVGAIVGGSAVGIPVGIGSAIQAYKPETPVLTMRGSGVRPNCRAFASDITTRAAALSLTGVAIAHGVASVGAKPVSAQRRTRL